MKVSVMVYLWILMGLGLSVSGVQAQSNAENAKQIALLKDQVNEYQKQVLKLEIRILELEKEVLLLKTAKPAETNFRQGTSNRFQQDNPDFKPETTPSTIDSPGISDTQCRATTKKGTRCSRRAKSNGYCFQHG